MMKKTLVAAAFLGLGGVSAASAAPIFADQVLNVVVGDEQGVESVCGQDRCNVNNILGATDGLFYEFGIGGEVELGFPGATFTGPGGLVEVTFSVARRLASTEGADIFGILAGVPTLIGSFTAASLTDGDSDGDATYSLVFAGVYTSLLIRDITTDIDPDDDKDAAPEDFDGIDIDSVQVSTVPVPAAGLLLAGALGALGLARRRKA